MQVHTFKIVGEDSVNISISDLYNKTVPSTPYLSKIIEYERNALSTLFHSRSVTSSPLLSMLMSHNNVDLSSRTSIQDILQKYIPHNRALMARHTLSIIDSIMSRDSMYDNIHCHMIIDGSSYIGHILSYDIAGDVGVSDVYISLSRNLDSDDMLSYMTSLIQTISSYIGENHLIVYYKQPLLYLILNSMREIEEISPDVIQEVYTNEL